METGGSTNSNEIKNGIDEIGFKSFEKTN